MSARVIEEGTYAIGSGQEGIARAEQVRPDAILLDRLHLQIEEVLGW